jgi:RNA polymerase sigma-70 factor (ECF subfamily)
LQRHLKIPATEQITIFAASAFPATHDYLSAESDNSRGYVDRSVQSVDAQLASLASAGDDAAFTTLVNRYHPAVYRWALIFARDPDDAEDIAQEAFVLAHRQISQYRSDGSIQAWLYKITRRAAGQARRTSKRRARLAMSPAAAPLRDVYTTDPGGRVDRERVARIILEFYAELPRTQREIFDLVDLQGLTPTEVAERTGMKAVSVRAHLFKARKAIRSGVLATHPAYGDLKR